jgi:D-3-phosphoglycerate dehydrogenase
LKLAVLDDYQRLALEYADWKSLKGVEVRVFHEAFTGLDQAAKALESFDIVCLMRERTPFPRALVEKLRNLKFVSLTGARSPSLDTQALRERGIPVSNTRSAGGGLSTVELAWGLIIAATRGLAKECAAWSGNLTPEKAERAGARLVSKNELFEKSDVVTIHLVLSDRTRGLVGAADLARMKPGAVLVNTSPGPIVEEAALISCTRTTTASSTATRSRTSLPGLRASPSG